MTSRTFAIRLGGVARAATMARRRAMFAITSGSVITVDPYPSGTSFTRDASAGLASYPGARTPIGYVNGDPKQPIYMNPAWERFLNRQHYIKLGGDTGPTLTEVQSNVVDTRTQAVDAATTVAAVGQQVSANAQVLAATVQVSQNNALTGASNIPPVVLRPSIPQNNQDVA